MLRFIGVSYHGFVFVNHTIMFPIRFAVFIFMLCSAFSAKGQLSRTENFPRAESSPRKIPAKKKVWVFILAGQSNMAGRGFVEPQDTIPNERILTINKDNRIIYAKEPLHFYEPIRTGLDCGMSFAKELLPNLPPDISILLIPAAVGGSSTFQWLGDSLYRDVKLMTNFKNRVKFASKHGLVKALLWHQGESDTHPRTIPGYDQRIEELFRRMRKVVENENLPVLIGELGSFSTSNDNWSQINQAIHRYAEKDANAYVIKTGDLKPMSDFIHFDGASQRLMGKRMAAAFLKQMSK